MLIIFLIYILNYKHSIDCRATVSRAYPIHLFVVLRILEPQLALPSFPFALLSANKAPAAPQLRLQLSVCVVCVCTLGMSFSLLGGCCTHRVATPPELKFPSSDVLWVLCLFGSFGNLLSTSLDNILFWPKLFFFKLKNLQIQKDKMAFHFSAMQVSEGERKRFDLLPNANLILLWMLFGVCLSALPTAVNRQRPNCSVSVVSISVIERGSGKIISNMASSIIGLDFNILWLNNSPKNFCSFCANFSTPTRTTNNNKNRKSKEPGNPRSTHPQHGPNRCCE